MRHKNFCNFTLQSCGMPPMFVATIGLVFIISQAGLLNAQECIKTFGGHTNLVYSVTFSPDGRYIASGGGDDAVKIWSVETGDCIKTLKREFTFLVMGVAFSPDGKYIASVGGHEGIRLWDIETGNCIKTLSIGDSTIFASVAFSPDGKYIAAGYGDNTIKFWHVETEQCIKTLRGHTDYARSVAFSPDGEYIVSTSLDTTIERIPALKIWSIATGDCIKTLMGHLNGVMSAVFSPNGKYIASGGNDNTIKIWDVETGDCIKRFKGHTSVVASVVFSPDGKYIASGSGDSTIKIWSFETGNCIKTLEGHTDYVMSIAFSPDGKYIASGGGDETIKLWDMDELGIVASISKPEETISRPSHLFGGKITSVSQNLRTSILDTLKVDGSEIAIITMENGDKIYMEFFPEDAPNTVKNFIMLANLGFYDGLTFHRVIKEPQPFVVQGGDPVGDGTGGPGYTIKAEFNNRSHLTATVAMARSQDPNSAASQFYICLAPQPNLDRQYTVFGQVVKGMDMVNRIKKGDIMQSVKIERKSIVEKEEKPVSKLPRVDFDYSISKAVTKPPKLSFDYSISDENGDKIFDGGEKVSVKIKVSNTGEGEAQGVKVLLSGDSKAISYLGNEKYIGNIPAGSEKEAIFESVLPYQIEAEQGNIIIKITEAQGFGALEEKELTVATQPAKVEREKKVISVLVDVDQPLNPTSFKRDNAYAVVIGISDYRSDRIPKIKYAIRDAEKIKDYLINICGIPDENIISLTNEKATLSDLTAYIEEWLQRNVDKNSFVFVFFAGHGTPNPEKGDAYLVPYDGEPGFISKLYPLEKLYTSLEKLPSTQIVVALDACFSGAGGRSVIESGKRPLAIAKVDEASRGLKKMTVITASAGDEISQDLENKQHGLFTYYFLKALRGDADENGDNWVTFGELYNYCKSKVSSESKKLGHIQTPKVFPEPLGYKSEIKLGRLK